MKEIEYKEIEPTWFNIEKNTINMCNKNNIDFWNYYGVFIRFMIFNYTRDKYTVKIIQRANFDDKIKIRAILNKRDISSKKVELNQAVINFEKTKNKLFNWLDKTKDPYFFILNPVYQYAAGIRFKSWVHDRYGYKKFNHTGTQNMHIAMDYINYRLGINTINHIKKQ